MRTKIALAAAILFAAAGATLHEASAAPLVLGDMRVIASPHGSIEPAYYYRGRYYPYRHRGMYFGHRRYAGGRWHYW